MKSAQHKDSKSDITDGATILRKRNKNSMPSDSAVSAELPSHESVQTQNGEIKNVPVWKPEDKIMGLYTVEEP